MEEKDGLRKMNHFNRNSLSNHNLTLNLDYNSSVDVAFGEQVHFGNPRSRIESRNKEKEHTINEGKRAIWREVRQ